jgi:hypothetical protein
VDHFPGGGSLSRLPRRIINRLSNTKDNNRSNLLFTVIGTLCELNSDDPTIARILHEFPNGPAAKYAKRNDLPAEIARCRARTQPSRLKRGKVGKYDPPSALPADNEDWEYDLRGDCIGNSQKNIRIALRKLDIKLPRCLRHRSLVSVRGKETTPSTIACSSAMVVIDEQFLFRPTLEFFSIVLPDAAHRIEFHPVLDHLDKQTRDGQRRLDNWLFTYGHAQKRDDDYNRSVRKVGRIA